MIKIKELISNIKFYDYDKKLLIVLISIAISLLGINQDSFLFLSVIGFSYYLGFEYFIISFLTTVNHSE